MQLKWDLPAARSVPIPVSEWDNHRTTITELFQQGREGTLKNIMLIMKYEHGFCPSKRQYVTQFKKWGLKRYNVDDNDHYDAGQTQMGQVPRGRSHSSSKLSTTEQAPCARGSVSVPGLCEDDDEDPELLRQDTKHVMRRPETVLPVLSEEDTETSRDAGEGVTSDLKTGTQAAIAIKKRGRNTPTASLIPSGSSGNPPRKVRKIGDSLVSYVAGQCSYDNRSGTEPPHPVMEDTNSEEEAEILRNEHATFPNAWSSHHDLLQIARNFDESRFVDSYSAAEMCSIRAAAEDLICFESYDYAFRLLVAVFQWQRLHPEKQRGLGGSLPALFECVSSVKSHTDAEIMGHLLGSELMQAGAEISKLEVFHMHILLVYLETVVETHNNNGNVEVRLHVPPYSRDGAENLLAQLDHHDRSLDFVTYRHLTYRLGGLPPLEQVQENMFLEQQIIERVPGPFELVNGRMQHECIRSCISWCLKWLSKKCSLEEMLRDWPLNTNYPNGTALFTVTAETLFRPLWHLWHKPSGSIAAIFAQDLALDNKWLAEAKTRMGISPTQLLKHCCSMIANESKPVSAHLSDGSLEKVRGRARLSAIEACKRLQLYSDSRLAKYFLARCRFDSRFNTLSGSNFCGWEVGNSASLREELEDVIQPIWYNRQLTQTSTEVLPSASSLFTPRLVVIPSSNRIRALHDAEAHQHHQDPAQDTGRSGKAESISSRATSSKVSSDMRSFQALSRRIPSLLRTAYGDTSIPPSKVFAAGSRHSKVSSLLSELSDKLSSTLQIS